VNCGLCERFCEAGAIDHNQQSQIIKVQVGSIIVATGFSPFDASNKSEYGYGRYDNVITGLEFERLINAAGPTGGHLVTPSDGRVPEKIAFIQCVGSRDKKAENLTCSRVCCMYAIKQAILAKEHLHKVDIYIFYMDIRAYGKGFEEFYQRAQQEFGIKFVRGAVSEINENPKNKRLLIRAEDTNIGKLMEEEFDIIVLSTALMPPKDLDILKKTLNLKVDEDFFFSSIQPEFSSVITSTEGIFIAGVAEGPKDIPDSISQASAAAMKASIVAARESKQRKKGGKK
jgi:heterodisulfide reductase subunit A